VNAEWERRTKNLPPNTGMEGSELHFVRKLEGGLLWGEKSFPKGRTSIRSSRSFCPPSTSTGDAFIKDLFQEARDLTKRSSYDASIKPNRPPQKLPMNDKFKREFEEEFERDDDKCCAGVLSAAGVFDINFYYCTDSFATRGEQLSLKEADGGIPSLSVSAAVAYATSTGEFKTIYVVAEAPLRTMGFVDACHDRIAGFVFGLESNAEKGQSNAVNITYVESCLYDLDTLDHDEKDAVLEDRALIVHRLLKNCPGVDAQNLLLEVSSPQHLPTVKPEATFLPPLRMVSFMTTTHRADLRWPLAKPNSLCLECGKDPTATGGKLLHCSKCNMRKFCSSECMAKSWKSDTWCHKVECKRLCNLQQSQVGTSMEEQFKELMGTHQGLDAQLSMLENLLGKASLKDKYESVEEMTDAHRDRAREARKAKRDGKKGKKKGNKK